MLGLTGHISSAQLSHIASGYCIQRCGQNMSIFAEYSIGNTAQDALCPWDLCYSLSFCPLFIPCLFNGVTPVRLAAHWE